MPLFFFVVASGLTSYEEMNEWELNKVFNDSVKNIDGNLIVLGDFNTGPEISNRNVSAEIPANYPQIEDLGKDSRELL